MASKDVIQRAYLLKHLARQLKIQAEGSSEYSEGYRAALKHLEDWVKEQTERSARSGGLGR